MQAAIDLQKKPVRPMEDRLLIELIEKHKVLFAKYGGEEVNIDGKTLIF